MDNYLGIAITLCLFSMSGLALSKENGTSLAKLNVIKKLHADLNGDGRDEDILVADRVFGKENQRLLIVFEGNKVLLESPLALPRVTNAYSPSSYDGFDVAISKAQPGTVGVVDIQGEETQVKYALALPGKYIVLKTTEEDNPQYNFNLQFGYDDKSRKMVLKNIFLSTNNASCDQSLKSVYAIAENQILSSTLENFNGSEAFHYLKELHRNSQADARKREKLMPLAVSEYFELALSAYKKGDKASLKDVMSTFIEGGGSEEKCAPENYIVEKYYYPNMLRWSNDLGFLFEQAGYFEEAAELLSHIVSRKPERTVAYLNLADSYWGLKKEDRASENYRKYYAAMKSEGKVNKVPRRVLERLQ